jgi:L-alanine-DL-glutamate epimerase-like enolase superfamily enzyme
MIVETASRRGRTFDDFNPFWFEESINPLDVESHIIVGRRISTSIAVDESNPSKFAYRDYMVREAADILQADATKVLSSMFRGCLTYGKTL